MNRPGHKYLGPGNKLNKRPPVDSDDKIAQDLDGAYFRAGISSEVRNADMLAIGSFTRDFVEQCNCSDVGEAGIGGKYLIESVVGVQYPRNIGVNP
ncbi:unnamed protein product [Allacma fusca]|uniref:Uncharacterized protein n=1 Tax=Allacma fusca TaxID=39272 RepID=A0A8J2JZB0_9HEXA|nr:unnamed protein product [Allacma fusca]